MMVLGVVAGVEAWCCDWCGIGVIWHGDDKLDLKSAIIVYLRHKR